MPKYIYIGGDNDKAKKVPDIYLGGADGTARSVKKGYIGGTDNKAMLFYERAEYHTVVFNPTDFVTDDPSATWEYSSSYEVVDHSANVKSGTNSTTFASVVPVYGNYQTSRIYLYFSNASPFIPVDAKITSVSARYKSAHSAGGIAGGSAWFTNYTAIFITKQHELLGSETNVFNMTDYRGYNARIYDLDVGDASSWTRDKLSKLYLRLTVQRSNYYSATDWDIRIYGCDLAVTYRY